jgi:hypothetical protein
MFMGSFEQQSAEMLACPRLDLFRGNVRQMSAEQCKLTVVIAPSKVSTPLHFSSTASMHNQSMLGSTLLHVAREKESKYELH